MPSITSAANFESWSADSAGAPPGRFAPAACIPEVTAASNWSRDTPCWVAKSASVDPLFRAVARSVGLMPRALAAAEATSGGRPRREPDTAGAAEVAPAAEVESLEAAAG